MVLSKIIHLEKVKSRFVINLSLKLISPLHIGSKSEGTNKMLLMFPVNGKMMPIIPAESLKGVLRSIASSLFKSYFNSKVAQFNIDLTEVHDKDRHKVSSMSISNNEKSELEKEATMFLTNIFPKEAIDELSSDQKIEYYLSFNCPVCTLFGAPGLSGKIVISDGIPNVQPRIITYTSSSIDRKTRVVKEDRLFTTIAVAPDEKLRYDVKIIVDNVEKGTDEAKLLSLILQYVLKFGIQIGGLKSYGYGKISIDESVSNAKILKLISDIKTEEDVLSNVRALLLKEGYVEKIKLEEFVKWLSEK